MVGVGVGVVAFSRWYIFLTLFCMRRAVRRWNSRARDWPVYVDTAEMDSSEMFHIYLASVGYQPPVLNMGTGTRIDCAPALRMLLSSFHFLSFTAIFSVMCGLLLSC